MIALTQNAIDSPANTLAPCVVSPSSRSAPSRDNLAWSNHAVIPPKTTTSILMRKVGLKKKCDAPANALGKALTKARRRLAPKIDPLLILDVGCKEMASGLTTPSR